MTEQRRLAAILVGDLRFFARQPTRTKGASA
jgi:hypothetical protein